MPLSLVSLPDKLSRASLNLTSQNSKGARKNSSTHLSKNSQTAIQLNTDVEHVLLGCSSPILAKTTQFPFGECSPYHYEFIHVVKISPGTGYKQ